MRLFDATVYRSITQVILLGDQKRLPYNEPHYPCQKYTVQKVMSTKKYISQEMLIIPLGRWLRSLGIRNPHISANQAVFLILC